jgi:hypothetical protein
MAYAGEASETESPFMLLVLHVRKHNTRCLLL